MTCLTCELVSLKQFLHELKFWNLANEDVLLIIKQLSTVLPILCSMRGPNTKIICHFIWEKLLFKEICTKFLSDPITCRYGNNPWKGFGLNLFVPSIAHTICMLQFEGEFKNRHYLKTVLGCTYLYLGFYRCLYLFSIHFSLTVSLQIDLTDSLYKYENLRESCTNSVNIFSFYFSQVLCVVIWFK